WYERGFNTASPNSGLPMGTTFVSAANPSVQYTLRQSNVNNALLLDTGSPTGTITLNTPATFSTLSFLGSAGNGAGTLGLTATFIDNTTASLGSITVPDWFNGANTALAANGRIDNGAATQPSFNNVDSGNPRLYEIDLAVPAAATTKPIQSIAFAWTGGPTNHTTIYRMSGSTLVNATTLQDFSGNNVVVTANGGIAI